MVLSSCGIDGQTEIIERCPLVVSNIKQGVRQVEVLRSFVISTSLTKFVHSWVLGGYYLNTGNWKIQLPAFVALHVACSGIYDPPPCYKRERQRKGGSPRFSQNTRTIYQYMYQYSNLESKDLACTFLFNCWEMLSSLCGHEDNSLAPHLSLIYRFHQTIQ